ncbi:MAG: hypothetical protein OEZ01_18425, partial [Candidatus Heimdallarchaeota archaeon]|nr:hypothetical protein [Candidatus Heimdallarchaeota archaeon]
MKVNKVMNMYSTLYNSTEWASVINSINRINAYYLINEQELLSEILVKEADVEPHLQDKIFEKAKKLTYAIKDDSVTDALLTQYDLSTTEGIALMCMAESLLRIPDQKTVDLLIKEKLEEGNWNNHIGKSKSFFVNTSTIGMLVAKKVVSDQENYANILTKLTKRLGKNITRQAILQTMRVLGKSFILGQNIEEGLSN